MQHGYVCDEWTCQAAASRGNLLTLKWLHARNVPWMEGVSPMHVASLSACLVHGNVSLALACALARFGASHLTLQYLRKCHSAASYS